MRKACVPGRGRGPSQVCRGDVAAQGGPRPGPVGQTQPPHVPEGIGVMAAQCVLGFGRVLVYGRGWWWVRVETAATDGPTACTPFPVDGVRASLLLSPQSTVP
jgi:hypothetical protein